ncbi:MAG: cytochrome P450 [Ilumatobacteraceae bacterium]
MAEPTHVDFDRHSPSHRADFVRITEDLHQRCPVAFNDTHNGHWFVSGYNEVFEIARRGGALSSDNDVLGVRKGYQGVGVPAQLGFQVGFLEMDPPDQKEYRQALNAYLSPAAVERWRPMVQDLTSACLDERIETGTIDFVDDLANVVPAVFTMAMMGLPLADWVHFCEPSHATLYTPPHSPDIERVRQMSADMFMRLVAAVGEVREQPRPGLIDALVTTPIGGQTPSDQELAGVLYLLIGGGFDTTTSLTANALDWLADHPTEREQLRVGDSHLLDTATEEFLRFFTPAPGDGRTVAEDCVLGGQELHEGDRLWLSWAMANRDPAVFPDPNTVHIDRKMNRHTSFGLGVHRCIGSNVARLTFKTMIRHVLDRMPDFDCDAAGTVYYESVAVINGVQHLPARFSPGPRLGAGVNDTIDRWQATIDDQRLAER